VLAIPRLSVVQVSTYSNDHYDTDTVCQTTSKPVTVTVVTSIANASGVPLNTQSKMPSFSMRSSCSAICLLYTFSPSIAIVAFSRPHTLLQEAKCSTQVCITKLVPRFSRQSTPNRLLLSLLLNQLQRIEKYLPRSKRRNSYVGSGLMMLLDNQLFYIDLLICLLDEVLINIFALEVINPRRQIRRSRVFQRRKNG
jgi:hypothetical protein